MFDDGHTPGVPAERRLSRLALLLVLVLSTACSQEGPPPGVQLVGPELPPPPPHDPPPPPVVIDSLEFVTTSLPRGTEGTPYEATIETRGGADSLHTFAVVEGRVPQGLVLEASTGVRRTTVHGTPTRDESRNFTVEVRDGSGRRATRRFSIRIEERD